MGHSSTIRAVTHRLTTTPVHELPHLVSFLAASLSECGNLLVAPATANTTKSLNLESGNAVQLHKLRTRLTTLLLDRSVEGRWSAVVLIKTIVEAGQWGVLHESEAWVRGLLAVLSKPDPNSTKKMAIITLTRIFLLTHQFPTLVRELTTPNLPTFISSALNLVSTKQSSDPLRKLKSDTSLLETVLHALNSLIARHPTIFRPFSAQIHSLLVPIIGRTNPQDPLSGWVIQLGQDLFVALHVCAPKNTSNEEWANALKLTIACSHRTADHCFRAIIEQWESNDPTFRHTARKYEPRGVVGDDDTDALGLPPWNGIHAGATRLSTLLQLVGAFFSQRSASAVSVPLGIILDLTSRLSSIVIPDADEATGQVGPQRSPEITIEEFDELQYELPRLHSACLYLFATLAISLNTGIMPVFHNVIDQAVWIFEAEKSRKHIRAACYRLLSNLLPLAGPALTKSDVTTLAPLIRSCCHDTFPSDMTSKLFDPQPETKGKSKVNRRSGATNVDSFLDAGLKSGNRLNAAVGLAVNDLQREASRLLPVVLTSLPVAHFSLSLRAELDRAAILVSQKDTMLASVINPVPLVKGHKVTPSILPFLARKFTNSLEVETLLRPRMPVLFGPTKNMTSLAWEYEDEEKDENVTSDPIDFPIHESISRTSHEPFPFDGVTAKRQLNDESMPLNTQDTGRYFSQIEFAPIKKARLDQPTESSLGPENFTAATAGPSYPPAPHPKPAVAPTSNRTATNPVLTSISGQQVIPLTLTEVSDSPATVGSTSISTAIATHGSVKSSPPSERLAGQQVKGEADEDEEDSGDEIPTLNVDPDTDDEEDDY